jgi:DNA replication and repair protein RecF
MESEPDASLMEILEREMAVQGEKVYRSRDTFVQELIPVFQKIYQEISDDKEVVSLRYTSHCQRGPLQDVIQRDRAKDRAVGYSLHGIHRDDLNMLIGDFQMRREGSQGQNKTFVLALKLAQFDFLKRTASHTTPILLLDDIFDKLDAQRVMHIVKLVSGDAFGQIFITDTNREHLDRILQHNVIDYKLFLVNDGDIEETEAPDV